MKNLIITLSHYIQGCHLPNLTHAHKSNQIFGPSVINKNVRQTAKTYKIFQEYL